MARKNNAMDGFVSRRPERRVGGTIGGDKNPPIIKAPVETKDDTPRPTRSGVSRAEIDMSLRGIDTDEQQEKAPKPRRRDRDSKPVGTTKGRGKKIAKVIATLVLVIGLGMGGYVGFKAFMASANVFKGGFFDLFQNQPLKQDANGRSNIIILGTSEDDPGHQGANLTDSMMILSIDQTKKNAFMVSIPRDLYVKYGEACNSGYQGKINEYYNCIHDGEGVDADRKALAKEAEFVGQIFGMDIQYGVNVNYTVMREMVNAVGGSITVNIEGNGPTPYGVKEGSVMDSNFDWKCGVSNPKYTRAMVIERCPPRGHFIDYGPGPQKLDAEHALYLAQARGDSAPTWGLAQSNFDREKNQQKIIKALKEKATSIGVLTDFGKVSSMIDALGNNLRTTFEAKEFRTLVALTKDIKNDDIRSISLVDKDDPIMGTDMVNGMSVVVPEAGTYNYTKLQSYVHKKMNSDPVAEEAAPIMILNGSGVAGLAQEEADKLEKAGYTISDFDNAPERSKAYPRYTVYQIGEDAPATASKLQARYKVSILKTKPPIEVADDVKFVVIVGPQPTDKQ